MSRILELPVIPLREMVLFPGVTSPIGAGRAGTVRAIETALETPARLVFASTQRDNADEARPDLLFTIGTIARIGHTQRGPNGIQLLLHGQRRGIALRIAEGDGLMTASVRDAEEMPPTDLGDPAYLALVKELRERAVELGEKAGLSGDAVQRFISEVNDPGRFADLIAAHVDIPVAERQALLEMLPVEERLRRVLIHVQRQITVLVAQEEIKSKVQEELGDRHREMVLRQQLKAIQKELGEDDRRDDVGELKVKLSALELPAAVRKEVDRELGRFERMAGESMEAQVVRTFLETVAELPWNTESEEHHDLRRAAETLDTDHYGLGDVKDRILEFLAVRQLRAAARMAADGPGAKDVATGDEAEVDEVRAHNRATGDAAAGERAASEPATDEDTASGRTASGGGPDGASTGGERGGAAETSDGAATQAGAGTKSNRGRVPILLFIGPPGVGKTSVARSIARAMGREYVRISLGGVRDEADIRGHRRTYVGAMPGRIIQGMKQAGTRNPIFLLDEVDKLGVSYQGDPASALLEVLDPAQNDSFTDHYLGVPFDLSHVLFICTANFIQSIPGPLLDRMEVVEFSGYTEREKLEIARRFLLPRQLADAGLDTARCEFGDDALGAVISSYTREAGVRQLEREIGRLARKAARRLASDETARVEVTPGVVGDMLGRPKVHPEHAAVEDAVGVATGMYYTPVGGDIMFVEVSTYKGKGDLTLTGQLGDVMKESARAALSYARANAEDLGIDDGAFERDIHIHVPAGAIPKDGPSAGVTMATALVSALSGRAARHDLAMTGEVTLQGRVLPIGGIKEKVLGAVRAGITSVVLPRANMADLEDLPEEVRAVLEVRPVDHLDEVFEHALRGASLRDGRLVFLAASAATEFAIDTQREITVDTRH